MSFGFKSINDGNYTQIDSELPRLCLLEKGSYSGSGGAVTVNFVSPVATVEPPMVFIRPSTSSNAIYRTNFLLGTSGNWTGFRITALNINTVPAGDWFVAAFASRGTSKFGMRLFSSAGDLVYDSGAYAVAVSGVLPSWTYVGKVPSETGAIYYQWTAGRGLAAGEYYMLNEFSLGVQDAGNGSTCGVSCDYTSNKMFMWSNGFSAWTDQGHRPVIFAKLVA